MAPACPPPARLGGSCVTATPRRQDRWQGRARRRGDGAPRMPHSPAQWGARRPGGLTDTRGVDSASSVGGSRGRRPTRHSLGEHGSTGARTPPARPSPVALVQWAAKVAFFKLKLDQLMDSLCRVCLAESKQNLEDKRPDSHRGTCASPTGAPPRASVDGSPGTRTQATSGHPGCSLALCQPRPTHSGGVPRECVVSLAEDPGPGRPAGLCSHLCVPFLCAEPGRSRPARTMPHPGFPSATATARLILPRPRETTRGRPPRRSFLAGNFTFVTAEVLAFSALTWVARI